MMPTTKVLLFSFAFFSFASCLDDYSLESCLRRDSISCVQIHIYNKLRALLSQPTIDLLAGFRIVQNVPPKIASEDSNVIEDRIYDAVEVLDRQTLLEDFILDKGMNFFRNRSIQWNMASAIKQIAPAARKFLASVPGNIKEKFVHYVAEGRGKKKFMKMFFPVIIAFKMTVFTWVKVIYVGVAIIAKKALVLSIIALIIAIFVAVKKHSYKEYRQPHYEIHSEAVHSVPYYPVNWPSGGHSGHDAYDSHASQSSPAHYLAFAAQKPNFT